MQCDAGGRYARIKQETNRCDMRQEKKCRRQTSDLLDGCVCVDVWVWCGCWSPSAAD